LDKSINASFGADVYKNKLPHYAQQNILAASLHPNTYRRNPKFRKFIDKWKLQEFFVAHPDSFDKKAIEQRAVLYRQLCECIWRADELGFTVVVSQVPQQRGNSQRRKPRYGVQVADLMRIGLLKEGTTLRGELKRSRRVFHAVILASGGIRLESSGEEFGSLSKAGAAATGASSNAGWDFWHVARPDGTHEPLTAVRKRAIEQGLLLDRS
jgi:hypothetical protein